MKTVKDLFWESSLEEMKKGYKEESNGEGFVCIFCGKRFEKGIVYPENSIYYEAQKAISRHITSNHGSVLASLLTMDKKYTGITELQKKLIELISQGSSDIAILKEAGGKSTSTIRNHRFSLREREKQAKIFLAIMELMNETKNTFPAVVPVSTSAKMVDSRFDITEEESAKCLKIYFKEGVDGPLSEFPSQEKKKIIVLRQIITRFEVSRIYSEAEVNLVLMKVWDDYVTIRRYLIEYGFMKRTADGSKYKVKTYQEKK
ncbi:MAG TPA: DUF2087 domain-containing protein [bacterium]|nr:DUF2087 domain-containing protein [bacterium]HPS30320.1 DUF2087 domain-containing protein [bacterium]